MLVRSLCLVFLLACGGRYAKPQTAGDAKPTRGIVAAALPYSILDARTGRQVDTEAFWSQVAAARVVCVGEEHPNPHHHWVQLEVMTHVATLRHGSKLALGMEMFQRPFQGVLDDYAAKRIDDAALRSRAGYEERWGYDYSFYGPTIDRARDAGAALLALNAPKEITKAVVKRGLEGLTADEKKQLPELKLDDAQHRAWFDATMEDMGGAGHGQSSGPHDKTADKTADKPADKPADKTADKPADKTADKPAESAPAEAPAMPSADRIYTAQVVWDETMADGAAAWAKAEPTGELVLLAGGGHCHDSAIVGRIKRRGVDKVISVQPVLDIEGRVAEALAKPMNDFLVVLQVPKK